MELLKWLFGGDSLQDQKQIEAIKLEYTREDLNLYLAILDLNLRANKGYNKSLGYQDSLSTIRAKMAVLDLKRVSLNIDYDLQIVDNTLTFIKTEA